MSWLSRLLRRPHADTDADLNDEIRFYLEREIELRMDRGESRADAEAHARRDFGNVTRVRETTREIWGWTPMAILNDVRHALRRLRGRPAGTAAAAGMLALGIGLATAMFTIIDALILRPVPFRDPDRLASIEMLQGHTGHSTVNAAILTAWRGSAAFEFAEGAWADTSIIDTSLGPVVRASAAVSPGVFAMLGVEPTRGRVFTASEGRAGSDDRVIISEELWRSAFGADPRIVGQRITVDGEAVTVIGLMPARFHFPAWNTVVWKPVDFAAPPESLKNKNPYPYVRVAGGVPMSDALRLATAIARPLDPWMTDKTQALARPIAGAEADPYYRRAVPLLAGGVVLVFLVLCANASSLLLARLTARQREFRVCTALGASRFRLLREAIVEHSLLGVGAALSGVALAAGLVALARAFLPQAFMLRTLHPLELDGRALGIAIAASIVAPILAGGLPAWIGTRRESSASVSIVDRGSSETRAARAVTRTLLVAEVALASMLLVGALLLVRSFINLATADRGLRTEGVMTSWIALPKTYADRPARLAITAALDDAVRGLPDVERLAFSNGLPPGGNSHYFGEGWRSDAPDARSFAMDANSAGVGPDFFDLYGIPLLAGRTFHREDDQQVAIVGERFAAAFWPGQDPVGHWFQRDKVTFRVVGLARETSFPSLEPRRDTPEFYLPFVPGSSYVNLNIGCRARCPDEAVIRRAILSTVPAANIVTLGLLSEQYKEEIARPRGAAALAGTFAVIAVLAAAGGLFSVLTYAVGRRRREFGIRTALGASPRQIRRLVVGDGVRVAVIGLLIGVAGAVGVVRVIATLQYGVNGFDPATWILVVAILAATTVAASWAPARRAARVNPVSLLRDE